ncbi:hypothetical protein M2352_000943 [Azospirillum fermentarium]|uniref:capsid assembly protein n=1 Tax=Azospirillum fermentarium TaxID=1233114 RepID=UPI002226594F|nr:hypothetical protein [Azospirillum fermentarium]MCW2245352.1 hypothetical protein [Azospirillum fermentarium]
MQPVRPDTPPAIPAVLAPPAAPPAPAPDPALAPFIDPATGAVQVEALAAAYRDLCRRVGVVPETPDAYGIQCGHGLFQPDPDINARLHGAGFSAQQAQLVYDLAAERMMPLIRQVSVQLHADQEMERLAAQFGGEARWREVSRQILAWARRSLPSPVVEALSTSYDGVMALYRMMRGEEPATLSPPAGTGGAGDASEVYGLMRDPRYWRDRDPAVVARVTEGFRRLYPGG